MISKIFSIRNYIMKQLMKTNESGIMKLPDKGKVDFGEMIIKEDLFKKGIDPKTITSETQLDTILNTPHAPTKPKKTGEVIDVDFGNWPEKKAGGGRTGYKDGFKVYPQISASKSNVGLGDGYNVDLQDLLYGGTIAYEKGPFSGGIEYLKGKNKYDFKDRDDTLQKDTSDDELLNLILKMELESGLKARLKGNKDNVMFNISKSFAQGGRIGTGLNYLLGEDDQNMRVPYQRGRKVYPDPIMRGGLAPMLGEPTYADGGRIGFGLGGGFNAARRAFLKAMGIGVAGVGVAKSGLFSLLKGGGKKVVIKDLTSIPIKSGVDGMPVWFKPLVNKVIKEGEDVTKKFATKEREIVHQVSLEGKIGKDALGVDDVRVTQSLDDGTISVQYNSSDTIGESGVELIYKKGEEIPIKKKGKSTSVTEKDEFTAVEDDFYPQATSPDGDFDLEFTENVVNKVEDLYSDTSKLKEFATGKKRTIKEISESIKKKKYIDEVEKNPNDHAFRNAPDYDGPDYDGPYEDDFASGGRVPMLFGGSTIGVLKNLLSKMKKGHGIGRGEKSLKPDIFAKKLMSDEDKLMLLQLETKYADSVLESLKIDRQLFKQLETNKEMKDQGLDFLMKHFVDTQAPHMKNYKSLADMDQAILELETLVKNKTLKEGRHLNATGGRVPLAGGGIMKLIKMLFKKKPAKLENLKDFIDRRKFIQTLILNTDDMKNKRMLQKILEEQKALSKHFEKNPPFKFDDEFLKPGSDFRKEIEMILSKDITKHAEGGRVPLGKGKIVKGLASLLQKKFPGTTKLGKTSKTMAEKTQLKQAIAKFQEREKVAKAISEGPLPGERAGIDVPDMPAGFKLSREKLKQNFPELSLDQIDEIMNLDRGMQGTVITMLKNRRLDPDLYDELLLKHGDTLKFQGEFDKAIRRRKNAFGGRVSLSAGGLAGMLGE